MSTWLVTVSSFKIIVSPCSVRFQGGLKKYMLKMSRGKFSMLFVKSSRMETGFLIPLGVQRVLAKLGSEAFSDLRTSHHVSLSLWFVNQMLILVSCTFQSNKLCSGDNCFELSVDK